MRRDQRQRSLEDEERRQRIAAIEQRAAKARCCGCRLKLPATGQVFVQGTQGVRWFCSDACADEWLDAQGFVKGTR